MALPRAQGRSVVPVLTGYLLLVEIVPSGWIVPAFGDVGTPANIYALLALIWYTASWLAGHTRSAPGTAAPRLALWAFAAAVLLGYLALADPARQAVGLETQAADRGLIGLAAWMGVVVLASAGIRDYAELQLILRRMVLYGSGIGALGIIEFFTSKDLLASVRVPGLRPSSLTSDLITRGSYIRPAANTSQPLELAAVLALLLPFALQQAFEPGRTGRLRRWLPVALIGGAMPLTVSRTSIIGLVVVLVMLLPTWRPARRWAALGFLALGAGVAKVAVPGLGTTVVNMFSALAGGGDASTQARTADFGGVAQYIEQRPWFGRGYGTFIPDLYRYTDDMYLLSMVEIGVFGTLVIAALFIVGYRAGRLGRRLYTDEPRRELGQCFAAAMVSALVVSATFDSLTFPMFAGMAFLLLGLSGAYLAIARREALRAGAPPESPVEYEPESEYEDEGADEAPEQVTSTVVAAPTSDLVTLDVSLEITVTLHFAPGEADALAEPDAPAEADIPAQVDAPPEQAEPPEPAKAASLGDRLRHGMRWSLINTIVIRAGTFITGVVLARGLLGPRDWGIYAIGLTALAVLLSANELGVSLAIVRWEGEVRSFAPTVLTLSVASSTALYLLLFGTAPAVAHALGASDATTMLRVLGISVIVDGIACVPYGLLTRTFAQRRRMLIDLANFVATTALTLGLAARGYGAMSFAWGSIAGNVVALAGCAIAAPGMLRPGWDRAQARKLLTFGLPLAGASLLVLAMLNTDSIVVGATLGPVQLGLYQIAFNISSWPVRLISEAARRVSFAGFSRVADSPRALAESFGSGLSLLMAAAVPTCVLLATLPKPLIQFVYGGQWTSASGALRFLAVLGLLRIAFELAYDCLVAAGGRRALIITQGWWLAALVPVLIFAARYRGIAGVGFGHVLVAGPLVAPVFVWALSRAGIPPRTVLRACVRPFLGGCAMTAVSLGVQRLGLGETTGLFVATAASTAVYVPFVWPLVRLARGRTSDADAAEPEVPQPPFPFEDDTVEIAVPELRRHW